MSDSGGWCEICGLWIEPNGICIPCDKLTKQDPALFLHILVIIDNKIEAAMDRHYSRSGHISTNY